MRNIKMLVLLVVALTISGCVTSEERIQELKNNRDIDGLIEMAADRFGSGTSNIGAINALEDIGKGDPKITDAFINISQSEDINREDVKLESIAALGRTGDKRSVDSLTDLALNGGTRDIRGASVKALGQIGDDSAIDVILTVLRNDSYNKGSAAEALDKIGWTWENETDYVYYLIGKQNSEELIKRAKYSQTIIIDALINEIKYGDSELAADILIKIGNPVVDPLLKLIREDEDPFSYKQTALYILNEVGWQPRKLPTGRFIKTNYNRGNGKLTVKNGLSWDAVVVLSDYNNKDNIILSVYINAGDTYTITGIPDGNDALYFKLGKDYDEETKKFTVTTSFTKFEEPLKFEITGDVFSGNRYSNAYEVTLYAVEGGNAETENINEDDFPNI